LKRDAAAAAESADFAMSKLHPDSGATRIDHRPLGYLVVARLRHQAMNATQAVTSVRLSAARTLTIVFLFSCEVKEELNVPIGGQVIFAPRTSFDKTRAGPENAEICI
jgi:hypothetical protein